MRRLRGTASLAAVLLLCGSSQAPADQAAMASDSITMRVAAHTGNDTLYAGLPGAVVVSLDGYSDTVYAVSFWCVWYFTNGNIVGPIVEPGTISYSARAIEAFESRGVNPFSSPTDPESTLVGLVDFGGDAWVGTGELFRVPFIPLDSGEIHSDLFVPAHLSLITVVNVAGGAVLWPIPDTPGITVVPCSLGVLVNGDADFDRIVTAADVIYLVNHTFKSGTEPIIWNLGDVNCDGVITAADIVRLVGYVFKSGAEPCDVCSTL